MMAILMTATSLYLCIVFVLISWKLWDTARRTKSINKFTLALILQFATAVVSILGNTLLTLLYSITGNIGFMEWRFAMTIPMCANGTYILYLIFKRKQSPKVQIGDSIDTEHSER